jgi:hypothetical protein
MTPRYVVVLESKGADSAVADFEFDDDVQAIVGARRVFVQALMLNEERPMSLVLGREAADGTVDWLNTWCARA